MNVFPYHTRTLTCYPHLLHAKSILDVHSKLCKGKYGHNNETLVWHVWIYCYAVQTLVVRKSGQIFVQIDGSNYLFCFSKNTEVILPGLGMAWKCGLVLPSDECSALQYNPEWTLNEFGRYGVSGNLCHFVCYCLLHSSCHKRFVYFSEKKCRWTEQICLQSGCNDKVFKFKYSICWMPTKPIHVGLDIGLFLLHTKHRVLKKVSI